MNPIGLPICRQCRAYFKLLGKNKYALYVVVVIMLLCMCNQASRFVLVATNVQMANEIHFGERECRSLSKTQEIDVCKQDSTLCDEERTNAVCGWYYTGTGYEYQLLAGPLFNIIFSFTSVPVGLILEKNKSNRKNVIAISAVLWSFMVILGGLATQYWHIAVTRLAIAFFEAPFTAFAISLLSSYFNQELRALALSIFTAGLHFGFSLAFIMKIIVVDIGWRSTYVVAGLPGIALAFITYITVKEPSKQLAQGPTLPSRTTVKCVDQSLLPAPLFNPLFVTIILAAAARCAGGRTYSYNINNYIQHYYPGYPTELYLSWLPACMGIISSIVGGVWADRRAIGEHGYIGRITVLIIGLSLSIPAAVLSLCLPPPWCFLSLVTGGFFHDMCGGIITTVIVEQAPSGQQTSALAIFTFTINMLGGNTMLLLPGLRKISTWQLSMMILWPGSFILSMILFVWSIRLAKLRIGNQQNIIDE